MLLGADSRLDDHSMESVWDQADDKVMLRELSIQSLVVGHIERNRGGIFDAGRKGLGGFEGSASCMTKNCQLVAIP